jgi:hypothetical protein
MVTIKLCSTNYTADRNCLQLLELAKLVRFLIYTFLKRFLFCTINSNIELLKPDNYDFKP